MNFEWCGRAYCSTCGITYSNVEPELIVKTELGREYIICPSCLNLTSVINTGDVMPKKPIKIKGYNIDSRKILEEISESGDEGRKRAEYIKHAIRTKRAEMRLDHINF